MDIAEPSQPSGAENEPNPIADGSTAVTPSLIKGNIDRLTWLGAAGWFFDAGAPEKRLVVEAVLDGKVVGRATADRLREDVAGIYNNDGYCGFSMSFDRVIERDETPILQVTDTSEGTVTFAAAKWSGLEGRVESITRSAVGGWVWIPSEAETAVLVELVWDGAVIASTIAKLFRNDLKDSGRGTGNYGFLIEYDGTGLLFPPLVRAWGPGGSESLAGAAKFQDSEDARPQPAAKSNSPAAAASPVEGNVDRVDANKASGWAWVPGSPDEIVEVEAVLDGVVIGRANADQLRPDLVVANKGDGRHGFNLKFFQPLSGRRAPLLRVVRPDGAVALRGTYDLAEQASAPAAAGEVESLDRTQATGWAWVRDGNELDVLVEAVIDNKIVGRALVDEPRDDPAATQNNMMRYSFALAFFSPLTGNKKPLLRVVRPDGRFPLKCDLQFPHEPGDEAATPAASEQLPAPSRKPELAPDGSVDLISATEARGWAWLPAKPDVAVEIEALLKGEVIGRAIANQMRPDLLASGKGTGIYGFHLRFDQPLTGEAIPVIEIAGAEGRTALPGNYQLRGDPNSPVAEQPAPAYEGNVDFISREGAGGWARMPADPGAAVQIEATLNGKLLGRAVANRFRSDLLAAGKGTGIYGFRLGFDRPLRGKKAPQIEIVGAEGRMPLPGNYRLQDQSEIPPAVEEIPPAYEGNVDFVTRGEADGWIWQPSVPEAAVEIEAVQDGAVIGRAIANRERQDLATIGKGTGKYGFRLRFDRALTTSEGLEIRVSGQDVHFSLPGDYRLPDTAQSAEITNFAVPAAPSVEGHLDLLCHGWASGWAWMPSAPGLRVDIEATIDGKLIGSARANVLREDLAIGFKGDARYGFTLLFNPKLDGTTVPLLEIVTPDGRFPLPGDHRFSLAPDSAQVEKPVSDAAAWLPEGNLDRLTTLSASGWAWLPGRPDSSVEIEAILDGKLLGRTRANKLHRGLLDAGKGTGRYGFKINFAAPISDKACPVIEAVCPEGRLALPGDYDFRPEEAEPPTRPELEGSVDYLNFLYASGWAWLPEEPSVAVELEAVLDGVVIGHTIADRMRPDLANAGLGTGRYGFHLLFEEKLTGDTKPVFRVIRNGLPIELAGEYEFDKSGADGGHVAESPAEENRAQGYVDRLTRRSASGWVWNPHKPEEAVRVEAVLDGTVIGRAIATNMREDLLAAGLGTGRYGFSMNFDALVQGKEAPILRALVAGNEALPVTGTLPALKLEELAERPRGTVETLLREHAEFTSQGPFHENFDASILENITPAKDVIAPLLIAFYLPQFHPIPENDAFWGTGFTEWRQLPRAISRFPGHYQPRIPRDLGFYDLRDIEALRRQTEMAKQAAVNAFAYYYYWFNRKRVLEAPLEVLLNSDIDMKFMLIWANENWTRTWDGAGSEILLHQDYKLEDETALLDDLARQFSDPRYVRVGSRPLFVIYNPKNVPDAKQTIARWRQRLASEYALEPLIFMGQTFGESDPAKFGCDGALEFPPHKLYDKVTARGTPDAYSSDFAGEVIEYTAFITASLSEEDTEYPLIKTIVPSWDNDSRRPNRGLILDGMSPRKYQTWLEALLRHSIDHSILGTPIVAINAWNEWAEAAYLEPDVYYGASFLNATARAYAKVIKEQTAIAEFTTAARLPAEKVTVIFPNYNHEKFIEERIQSVLVQSHPVDEIIFMDDCSSDNSVELARRIFENSSTPYRIVLNDQNSGCVFKQWIKGIQLARNELIWIAETDDTVHRDFLSHLLPHFSDEEVMAAYGRISYINEEGKRLPDLDNYYTGMKDFSWFLPNKVPAFQAFSWDFAITNVVPNASGLVFRKPRLTEQEMKRLTEYRFAGDWYFYCLMLRAGSIAFEPAAQSYFRLSRKGASQSSFFTERHLAEHAMILDDLWQQYDIGPTAIEAHASRLAEHFPDLTAAEVLSRVQPHGSKNGVSRPLRICIASLGFSVGGGEVMPLHLANALREMGHHVTYLAHQRLCESGPKNIRSRLRPDIPVVYWDDVRENFGQFLLSHGIEVMNSHNVGVEFHLSVRAIEIGVPYVVSLHGSYETVPEIMNSSFGAWLNRTVNSWLYLSEKNTEPLRGMGIPEDRFYRSFNAVPPFTGEKVDREIFRAEHGIASDDLVAVLCSRAIKEKGWQIAIDAVKRATVATGRNVHLVLIGDGPYADELKLSNAKSKNIIFMGYVESPVRYFGCFDLGIFPSTFVGETFPLFMIECFQCGLPLLSTDIGEIPFIMGTAVFEQPGAMVSYKQKPKKIGTDIAQLLINLIKDETLMLRMKENAIAAGNKYSIAVLAADYVQRFRNLIAEQEAARAPASQDDLALVALNALQKTTSKELTP